jgi:hypothetical protein
MRFKFFIILFVFLILSPTKVLAQEFTVTGVVTDEMHNPIAASTLEFENSSGESVGKADTTYDGSYEIQVSADTYVVKIDGPEGSGIGRVEYENQVVSGDTKLNYVLEIEDQASSSNFNFDYLAVAITVGIILFLLLGIIFIYKRKK